MEARQPIRTKYHPRHSADAVRKYLAWAETVKTPRDECEVVRRILDQYEAATIAELEQLEDRLMALRAHPGIEVFPLSDDMLARAVELATENLDLKPFDQAILAAILVQAKALRREGVQDLSFCELDNDLQPWDKQGRTKPFLASLYEDASVWVYGDFVLEHPPKRASFPEH
jgi:predicted P-loop ATPase